MSAHDGPILHKASELVSTIRYKETIQISNVIHLSIHISICNSLVVALYVGGPIVKSYW